MESLWSEVSAWVNTGGFFESLFYLTIYGVPFLVWHRLPQAGRDRVSSMIGRLQGHKAARSLDSIDEGINMAVNATQSRVFVVRIGTWKTTDAQYCREVKRLIEADHIWDWHFFLDKPGADPVGWLDDFFETGEHGLKRPLVLDEKNATTQVSLCKKAKFFKNKHYLNSAKYRGIPKDWDEIIIYGTVEGLSSFPRAKDLLLHTHEASHSKEKTESAKLTIQGVMYFHYRNHEDEAHLVRPSYQQRHGRKLLRACVDTREEDMVLFIDQPEDITPRDKEQALRLGNYVLAQGRLPTNPGV